MSNGLTTEEQKTIAAVFARVPAIERAVLFGSRAMGLARGNSDVDIALYGDKLGLPDILHTASLLEETPLPYHFDLISYASITSPDLLEHIRQYGKEMYRKESNPQEKCSSERCIAPDGRTLPNLQKTGGQLGMRSEWAVLKATDFIDFNPCETIPKGVMAKKVAMEHLQPFTRDICAYEVAPFNGGSKFRNGDSLMARITPCLENGKTAQVNILDDGEVGFGSTEFIVCRAKPGISDKDFIYYLAISPFLRDRAIKSMAGTSGRQRVQQGVLNNTELWVPPLSEQRAIADTLSSLDDKIENNRKINQCLEQMAQAIFKSWFVDFEPWGGVMPNDWREGTFTEVISTTLGGDWGKDALSGNNTQEVYCIRGADIPDVNVGNKGKMPIRFILPKNYSAKRLGVGDIVIEISGGSPTQSTGRCALITQSLLDRYDRGMVCTNFCRAVKPFKGYSSFVYFYWKYLYDQNVMFSYENGTTGIKNLDISSFLEKELVILPPADVVSQFAEAVGTFINTIYANGLENEVLATTRDALLPRLMSGELSVGDVEAS